MAIINERWPRDLCPETCTFTRTRNDVAQRSPRTRQTKLIRMGRPLYTADVTWTFGNDRKLAKLRYMLESLDGFAGSVQIWNFACPYPYGADLPTVDGLTTAFYWTYLGNKYPWNHAGFPYHWKFDGPHPTTSAAAALGATSVALTGLDPSKLTVLQGQSIQIGRRIYLVKADASSNGAGAATVQFMPGLLAAIPAGTEVRLVEAACEMQLADQNFKESARATDGLISVSASFIETVTDLT